MFEDEVVAAGAAAGAGAEAGVLLLEESALDFDSPPDFDSLLFPSPLLFALAPSPEDLGLALP